ncbi:hypothetical protein OSTOST_17097, partial [Ostertagia ostertagi]
VAKNEILNSELLLEKERYDVDILKRRAAFVEKPEDPPEIVRTGRRWQPPPEKPYMWPTVPRPGSVGVEVPEIDYPTGAAESADDNAGVSNWPTVTDPTRYMKEAQTHTTESPPLSIRRVRRDMYSSTERTQHRTFKLNTSYSHHRTGVIDLSQHSERNENRLAVVFTRMLHSIVKRRPASAQGLLAPVDDGGQEQIEVIEIRLLKQENGAVDGALEDDLSQVRFPSIFI